MADLNNAAAERAASDFTSRIIADGTGYCGACRLIDDGGQTGVQGHGPEAIKLLCKVSSFRARAVASFDRGSRILCTIIAATRSRCRLGRSSISASSFKRRHISMHDSQYLSNVKG